MAINDPTLSDYIAVLKRRKVSAAVALTGIVLGFVYFAYTLPAVYQSEAVIVIEQQELPTDLVDLETIYPEERIQEVRQRVMTVSNVTRIIEDLNLYADRRDSEPIDNLVAQFRADTEVAPESASIVNRNSGRVSQATFAFSLLFNYHERVLAKSVADELAALFVAENDEMGVEQAAETIEFLRIEAERLESQLQEIEQQLAEFKSQNSGALPENASFNLESLRRLEVELSALERQLRVAREQKALLETELTQLPRYAPLVGEGGEIMPTSADRIVVLQQELATLLGRYSEGHPDVVNLRRELVALTGSSSASNRANALLAELATVDQELATARERYSDTHPDVVRLQRSADSLRAQIDALPPLATIPQAAPNHPVYLQTVTRIEATDEEIRALTANRNETAVRIANYEQLLQRAPEVERQYNDLTREYDIIMDEYQGLRASQRQAEIAQSLEAGGRQGEIFTIIEPPRVPVSPVSPNRLSLVFLGIVLGLTAALVIVALREGLDSTVRGQKDILDILEMPPLAIIPYIENRKDQRKRTRNNFALVAGFAGAIGFVAFSVFFQTT